MEKWDTCIHRSFFHSSANNKYRKQFSFVNPNISWSRDCPKALNLQTFHRFSLQYLTSPTTSEEDLWLDNITAPIKWTRTVSLEALVPSPVWKVHGYSYVCSHSLEKESIVNCFSILPTSDVDGSKVKWSMVSGRLQLPIDDGRYKLTWEWLPSELTSNKLSNTMEMETTDIFVERRYTQQYKTNPLSGIQITGNL